MSSERPMSLKELAAHLKAAPSTLSKYVREGMGEACGFKVGKSWRFIPSEVVRWLRDRPARKKREAAGPIGPAILDAAGREARLALSRALGRDGITLPAQEGGKSRRKGGDR